MAESRLYAVSHARNGLGITRCDLNISECILDTFVALADEMAKGRIMKVKSYR